MASNRLPYEHGSMQTARLFSGCSVCMTVADIGIVPPLLDRGTSGIGAAVLLVALTLAAWYYAANLLDDLGLWFEYRTRSRFRAVCREKGLVTKDGDGRITYPRLYDLAGGDGVTLGRIRPLLGQSVADWERAAPAFALAYAVSGVRFKDKGDGTLQLVAGYRPLESRDFEAQAVTVGESVSWAQWLASVLVGYGESGEPYTVSLLGSHVLVAGITGSGKGSLIWSLLLRLEPAARAGVVKFWGIDPKRLELAIGRGFFGDRYARTDEEAVAMLERLAAEMLDAADSMAGQARKIEPSPLHPVNVIVIDELGYLSALMPDRKLRDRAEKALSAILVLGRAMGYVVVGALQDPRKEVLNFRDLFPTCIAMKLRKPMVDLVLGAGMYENGARCDEIPPRNAGAGVAFVVSEDVGMPQIVRFTWCSDKLIQKTAGELAPVIEQLRLREAS